MSLYSQFTGTTIITRTRFVATANQTVFTVAYKVGLINIYMGGAYLMPGIDFTATNNTSFTLAGGATAGVEVVAETFSSPSINPAATPAIAPLSTVSASSGAIAAAATVNTTLDSLDPVFAITKRTFSIALMDIVAGSTDAYQLSLIEYNGATQVKIHYQSASLTGPQKDALPFTVDKTTAGNSLVMSILNQSATASIPGITVRFVLGSV